MLKLLTGNMLPPQLQVFLPMLRRNRSKELRRVKKTLQAESRQLFESHSLGSDTLLVSLRESQLLSSSWNMYWHRTKLGGTITLFWVCFTKHLCYLPSVTSKSYLDLRKLFHGFTVISSQQDSRSLSAAPQSCGHRVSVGTFGQGERMQPHWRVCLLQLDTLCYTDPFCSLKGWSGCPGMWWNHHPWKHLKNVWMWHLGTWFRAEHAGFRLVIGLHDLRSFPALRILWFYDPCIPQGKQ